MYPELEWLLDKSVQQTQEGKSEQFEHSWSKQLTGQHYPEFERTMLSMVCLYLLLMEAHKPMSALQCCNLLVINYRQQALNGCIISPFK